MSDHGVMARFPYLDENLVNFLCELDTGIKCCLDLPRGVGEKLILRQDFLRIIQLISIESIETKSLLWIALVSMLFILMRIRIQ